MDILTSPELYIWVGTGLLVYVVVIALAYRPYLYHNKDCSFMFRAVVPSIILAIVLLGIVNKFTSTRILDQWGSYIIIVIGIMAFAIHSTIDSLLPEKDKVLQEAEKFRSPFGRQKLKGTLATISKIELQREYEKELHEAATNWMIFLDSKMSAYGDQLAGHRVMISNERWPGTREIAMILEYGLKRLGVTIVTDRNEPYDLHVFISKYSMTDALVVICDPYGNKLASKVAHHEAIVSYSVHMLATNLQKELDGQL